MSLPDINFEKIRPVNGNRYAGFEEICCQLAYLEATSAGDAFHRKGPGGDAGVECYSRSPHGKEIGWQAKYVFGWDRNLATQLSRSIQTALDKHPEIVKYIVCLPFDLSDSRIGRGQSAKQKWNNWCRKWKKFAQSRKRDLTIELWGNTELLARLMKVDPGYLLYWFDRESLTADWFRGQFEQAKDSLGNRYIPESNVELPIRQDFLAFARHSGLQKQIDGWFLSVSEEGRYAVNAIRRAAAGGSETHSGPLKKAIDALAFSLGRDPIGPDQPYPLDNWNVAASICLDVAQQALSWVHSLPPSRAGGPGNEPERWAQQSLYRLIELLNEIRDAVASNRWQLTNQQAVLLQGPAGIGKSHLLGDIVEHHLQAGGPALLFLGSMFVDDEPGRQILARLDRPPTEHFRHMLGALDAAAQMANVRTIVCIDALNERHGIDIWPHRLAALLTTFRDFPRVGVVLSCRSTYVPYVLPEQMDNHLFRVNHEGFAGDAGEAAKAYLDKRGIMRPGAPNLVPEFDNPLFLKTCCDFLEKQGQTELPKGMRGVTSLFRFYNEAITQALNRRMHLDPNLDIVPKAIGKFARSLARAGKGYVTKKKAIALFETVFKSEGRLDRSLLSQLESEGLLSIEAVRQKKEAVTEMARFTFERFSDHEIAKRLLDGHLDPNDVTGSFQIGRPLWKVVFGPANYKQAGVIEAIAIQLPERTNVEILDVGNSASSVVRSAFTESLLWREQLHFTARTLELARAMLETDELNDLLVSIAAEPSNRFNARFVHERLMQMTMPERDACWSIYLAWRRFNGPVQTLISWAMRNGMEPVDADRAHLAATMLAWFLTTSHREVRDKATKALACLLSKRLPLAARLLKDFAGVNDLYVLERLLAACYGAALQGTNERGLDKLAQTTFDTIFADGKPPANALLRDSARGIIEYAAWRGVLDTSISLTLAQPPYQSPWPIEFVPDELIESYVEDRGHGSYPDAIVRSTTYEAGDFAKYIVWPIITNWSPAKYGTTAFPTPFDMYKTWEGNFVSNATPKQLEELNLYKDAVQQASELERIELEKHSTTKTIQAPDGIDIEICSVLSSYKPNRGIEILAPAELRFRRAITPDEWEEFRVQAAKFLNDQRQDQPVEFDIHWACRWICKRAHELGWTSDRFGDFDNSRGYGRHDHKIERIGKKYQWLALNELLARMADNMAYLGRSWERNEPHVPVYHGARQIGLRDIDPSLLTTATHYDGWREWDKTWWVPFVPKLRAVLPDARLAWLEGEADIINDSSLIDVRNPKVDGRWLALKGFSHWAGWGVHEGSKVMQRETWFRLTCFIVPSNDQGKAINHLRGQILTSPDSLPRYEPLEDFLLGEHPWNSSLEIHDLLNPDGGPAPTGVSIRPTVVTYTRERGGYDYSMDRTVGVNMPAPWLAKIMGLRLANGRFPTYVGPDEKKVFYDPSVVEAGPAAALVDRDAFLTTLDEHGLSAIWVIAGEKSVYGGSDPGMGFGGCVKHTAMYFFDGKDFRREYCARREDPSAEQLERFSETSSGALEYGTGSEQEDSHPPSRETITDTQMHQ